MAKKELKSFGTAYPGEEDVSGIKESDDVVMVEAEKEVAEPDIEEPAEEEPIEDVVEELQPDIEEDVVDEDVEGIAEIDPPIDEKDIPIQPGEPINVIKREPTTWEWMSAGITQMIAHADKYQAGAYPMHDKPSHVYIDTHREELSKDLTTEVLAKKIMEQKDDRPRMMNDLNELVDSERGMAFALGSAATKALMLSSFPTIEQKIQKDPHMSKLYNTTYFGASMIRDYVVTRGLVKGGSVMMPDSAKIKTVEAVTKVLGAKWSQNLLRASGGALFESVQATFAGTANYNELKSLKRTTGKETQAELNGIIMAASSFTAGMLTSEVVERGAGFLYKWFRTAPVMENILNRPAAKVASEIAGGAAAGFSEGVATAVVEEELRDRSLRAAGEIGTGGAKWESAMTAGLFSMVFRAGRNWHLLKQEGYRDNFVEKFVENTNDVIETVKDPTMDIATASQIDKQRMQKLGEKLRDEAFKIAKITGDPDSMRAEWRDHLGKKVKDQDVKSSVKTEARLRRMQNMAEVTVKMKDDLSGYWYQKIKSDNPEFTDKDIKTAYNDKMKSPLKAWAEKVANQTPESASKFWAIDAEMEKLDLGDDSLRHVITKTYVDSWWSAESFVERIDGAVEEVHNFAYLDSLVEKVNSYENAMGFKDTKEAHQLVREMRGIDDPKEVIHSITSDELSKIGNRYYDAFQSYRDAESKLYKQAKETVLAKVVRLGKEAITHPLKTLDKAAETVEEGVLMRNISEDTDLIIKLSTDEYTRVQAMGVQAEIRNGNVLESRARNSFEIDEGQISYFVHDNNVDMLKARAYMDELDNAKNKGELTPEFQRQVATRMDLSLKDMEYARKMGNFTKQNEDITFELENATPEAKIDIFDKKKSFGEISDADVGNWYHPRQWSEAGKAELKTKGVTVGDEDFVNSRFGRSIDSMALGDRSIEHRLSPGSELNIHFNKNIRSMALRGQNKAINTLFNDTFGMKNGMEPWKLSDFDFKEISKMSRKRQATYLLARSNMKLQKSVNYINDELKMFDTVVGGFGDNASMLAIGSLKPFFLARNSLQGVNNGLPYLYGMSLMTPVKASKDAVAALGRFSGFVLRDVAAGAGTVKDKITKKSSDRQGYQKAYTSGLNTNLSNPEKALLQRVFHKNLTDTHLEFVAMSNFTGKKGIGLQVEDFKLMDTWGEKATVGINALWNSIEFANQAQLRPLGASDLVARVSAGLRGSRYFDEVYKRNQWDAKNPKHAQKKYNKMVDNLHFDIMGEGRRLGLQQSFDNSLKTGDFTEFKDLYAAAWVERLCFGYGINDAPRYQNEMKGFGRIARLATRFTNWPVKNRHNLVGIVKKARKGNFVPLSVATTTTLLAYGVGKAMVNYIGEDNDVVKLFDKYGMGSTYGANLPGVPSLYKRAAEPLSLLEGALKKMSGTAGNSVLRIADELGYDVDIKEDRNAFGLIAPSTEHIIDAFAGTEEMIKDMKKMFGSTDEFILGVENSWNLLTEDTILEGE